MKLKIIATTLSLFFVVPQFFARMDSEAAILRVANQFRAYDSKIRTLYVASDPYLFGSHFHSGPIRVKRLLHENNTDAGNHYTYESSNGRPESPTQHIPLRLEVLFRLPLAAFGLLLACWGLDRVDWRDKSVTHVLECAVAMLAGAFIFAFSVIL